MSALCDLFQGRSFSLVMILLGLLFSFCDFSVPGWVEQSIDDCLAVCSSYFAI